MTSTSKDNLNFNTKLSAIDGNNGHLTIAGFALEDIAPHVSLEQMTYLLWHDQLPNNAELQSFTAALAEKRYLPKDTVALLKSAAQHQTPIIDALRLATDSLSIELTQHDTDQTTAIRLLAAIPTIVASYWRLKQKQPLVEPDNTLNHANNFLYMLTGTKPTASSARALEIYLNTTIEHGFNASTFTARVITATESDFISAIVGAIGALKGPLHGGAPGPALQMVFDIAQKDQTEPYLRNKLDHGERLMGFGHRVYKTRDPRADILANAAKNLYQKDADQALYQLAMHVERTALALLSEYKPHRPLHTNVEFYTALLLHGLGINDSLFTPIFAISRTGGWLAHCFEQRQQAKLIRPQSHYTGVFDRRLASS